MPPRGGRGGQVVPDWIARGPFRATSRQSAADGGACSAPGSGSVVPRCAPATPHDGHATASAGPGGRRRPGEAGQSARPRPSPRRAAHGMAASPLTDTARSACRREVRGSHVEASPGLDDSGEGEPVQLGVPLGDPGSETDSNARAAGAPVSDPHETLPRTPAKPDRLRPRETERRAGVSFDPQARGHSHRNDRVHVAWCNAGHATRGLGGSGRISAPRGELGPGECRLGRAGDLPGRRDSANEIPAALAARWASSQRPPGGRDDWAARVGVLARPVARQGEPHAHPVGHRCAVAFSRTPGA